MVETQKKSRWSKKSLSAQAMGKIDARTKAVVPPIHISTTYIRDPDNGYSSGFIYGRPDNETVREAEAVLAMWEEASSALLFSSGMAAATAVFMALRPGDHVVAPSVMYWALRNWLMTDAVAWGLDVSFVDMANIEALRGALKPGKTKLVWVETPSNPLWSLTDLEAAADWTHAVGAKIAVDSTVATPVFTRPLTLGVDIVMHAATKSLNGHSDVIAGAYRHGSGGWRDHIGADGGDGDGLGDQCGDLCQRAYRHGFQLQSDICERRFDDQQGGTDGDGQFLDSDL